jgi:hypothetical protein
MTIRRKVITLQDGPESERGVTSPTPLPPPRRRGAASPTALPRKGYCPPRSRQSRIAGRPQADPAARIGGLFQPALDVVLLFKLAEFRGDDADQHDLVAFRQIAQRLDAAGAVESYRGSSRRNCAGQHGFRHRFVAAGGNPGGVEIAAAGVVTTMSAGRSASA